MISTSFTISSITEYRNIKIDLYQVLLIYQDI